MLHHDDEGCAYVEDGKQCEKPARIKVKTAAPQPYQHLMMEMWLCAEHYDQWMRERGDAKGWIKGEDECLN